MTTTDYHDGSKSGGMAWVAAPVILILFLGAALSVGAYFQTDPQLTIAESLFAGYGALAGLIVALIVAAVGVIVAVFTALMGLVAAGGAVAVTLFVIGSPIIALILLFLLMRRSKADCPDPAAHR